jgi:hypothetical protein
LTDRAEKVSGADLLADALEDLAELVPVLAALLPEPVGDPTTGTTAHRKHAVGSPAPWHPEAGPMLMTVHEGVRRMEASMRQEITGRLGGRRGGSDANTTAAMRAIENLGHGLPDDRARYYARIVGIWTAHARTVRDIDQAPKWSAIAAPKGTLPPQCPYCRTYMLRVAMASGAVTCANPSCVDSLGQRPRGRMEYGPLTGRAMLVFTDGREITHYTGQDQPRGTPAA